MGLARLRRRDEGFTLVELIIVVVILGALTAIAIPAYGAIRDTAKKNVVTAAAKDAHTQIVETFAEGGSFKASGYIPHKEKTFYGGTVSLVYGLNDETRVMESRKAPTEDNFAVLTVRQLKEGTLAWDYAAVICHVGDEPRKVKLFKYTPTTVFDHC